MRNPDESELIERYLSDNLAEEEQTLFEKRLSEDPELREMVNLHRLLFRELGDEQQLRLLKSLNEITEKPYNNIFRRTIKQVIVAISLLLACAWGIQYFMGSRSGHSPNRNVAPKPVIPDMAPAIDTPKATPAPPIASLNPADFRPNPSLEGLVGTSIRGDESLRASFAKPEPTTRLLSRTGTVRVAIKGSILTTDRIVGDKDFTLLVYSNREADFNAGKYLFSTQSVINPVSTDEFTFSASPAIKLKPGLYYIVLTETGFNEPVAVTNFRVEQN